MVSLGLASRLYSGRSEQKGAFLGGVRTVAYAFVRAALGLTGALRGTVPGVLLSGRVEQLSLLLMTSILAQDTALLLPLGELFQVLSAGLLASAAMESHTLSAHPWLPASCLAVLSFPSPPWT